MTILDTFYLVIKGDTTDLKSKNQELETETQKLEKSLHEMDSAGQKAAGTFFELGKRITGLLAAYYSFDAIVGGFKRSLDYAIQLDQNSRALNVNIETLDAWGNAIRRTGGTAEGFQSSLKSFAQHLGTTNATALKVLPRLANTFQRLGQFRAFNYGKQLGLDEPTILLLQKGRREVDSIIARQKELGVVTKKQAEIVRQFKFALDDTGHAFRSLSLTVGETVTPIFTKFLGILTDLALYFREHKDFVIGALIAIGSAATVAAVAFGALSAPVILAAAAVGEFALIYDDIKGYLNGSDSLLGRAIKKWEAFRKVIQGIGYAMFEVRKGFEWLTKDGEKDTADILRQQQRLQGIDKDLAQGKGLLATASSTPLNSISNSSVLDRRTLTAPNITIGDINITTQASTPDGVGEAVQKTLRDHLWQANNQFANGVAF